ncbi:preprotein translocase subunit Sec61beta [Candidatus Woesearchaeota archaeon]|nr:preprotein translocase subunit Sec61beta [Candidatus Woesearchaeota archaeon]
MVDNRIRVPISQAGITRYFDEFKTKLELQPMHVVVLIAVIVLLEILLHAVF